MGVIWWVLFGLIVGILAKLLMPGKDPGGFIITIILGIAGSVIGGWIGQALGLYGPDQTGAGIVMSVLGAVILLAVYRLLVRQRVLPGTTGKT